MFCSKCGNNVQDGVKFCTSCGAPMMPEGAGGMPSVEYNMAAQGAPAVGVMKKPINKKMMITVGGAIAVIAAVVVLLIVLLGGTKQAALDRYVKGLGNGDVNKILTSTLPSSKHEEYAKKQGYGSKKELINEYKERFNSKSDHYTYKAKLMEKVDLDEDRKEWIIEDLKEYNITPSKIERHKIKLTTTFKGKTETEDEELTFYKYKGKWYVYDL